MLEINENAKNKQSILFSFLNTIPYAIIPLIWLVPFDLPDGFLGSISKAVVVTVSKDLLSVVFYLSIVILKGDFIKMLRLAKSKAGALLIIGGIFGGPIGYVLFNAAFFYAGASYSHIFVSLEPIIMAVISILWFKRKYTWKLWIGIIITIFAIMALVFGKLSGEGSTKKILIGALLGILGALSWALETILFDKTYNIIGKDKKALFQMLSIKTFFSVLFGFGIMFSISSELATNNPLKTYIVFADIFTNNNYLLRFFIAGILIIIGRSFLFYALERSGGTIVTVIYNLTIVLTPLFAFIWYLFSGNIIDPSIAAKEWIPILAASPFIILGITITTIYKPKINREIEKKEDIPEYNKELL